MEGSARIAASSGVETDSDIDAAAGSGSGAGAASDHSLSVCFAEQRKLSRRKGDEMLRRLGCACSTRPGCACDCHIDQPALADMRP